MLTWLRHWLKKPVQRPYRRTNRKSTFRPWIECLEDRVTPTTFVVNTLADEVTPGDGKLSLREAIMQANAAPGPNTVLLSAGSYKLSLGELVITNSMTIKGAGASLTTV